MQLEKSLNKTLTALVVVVLILIVSLFYSIGAKHTFAEGDGEAWDAVDGYFVNFYDSGETLTVKTTEVQWVRQLKEQELN